MNCVSRSGRLHAYQPSRAASRQVCSNDSRAVQATLKWPRGGLIVNVGTAPGCSVLPCFENKDSSLASSKLAVKISFDWLNLHHMQSKVVTHLSLWLAVRHSDDALCRRVAVVNAYCANFTLGSSMRFVTSSATPRVSGSRIR